MRNLGKGLLVGIVGLFAFSGTALAYEGIDVSEFQGDINFKEVKSEGIEVVYIRSSAGNSYVDANFERNYREAKANNLKIGVYHYVTARTVEEAHEQAVFFAHVLAGKEIDCLLAMDFERFPGLNREEINAISKEFLETVERLTNKKTIVYSDVYNAKETFLRDIYENYPLWLAEYGVERPEVANPRDYLGWQYTDRGRVKGIRGDVDRDIFKEGILLDDKMEIKEPDLRDEEKKKIVYYRIQRGDTLTNIAREYGVTVSDLIKWNDIKRPNLIFPDRVLKIETDYKYKTTSKGSNSVHIVKKGENLTKIAYKYKVNVTNIVSWNKIKNSNLIYPKQRIEIKPTKNEHLIRYQVRDNDNLKDIALAYNVELYELKVINNLEDELLEVGEELFIPVTYIF